MSSSNIDGFKTFKIPYEKIQGAIKDRGSQYKRICQDYAAAFDLNFAEYWDNLRNYSAEQGAAVFKKMLNDTEKPVELEGITVYGGEEGYICAKFFKNLRGSEDYSVELEEVMENALVVLDTDVGQKLAPPKIDRKRGAMDVSVFETPQSTVQRTEFGETGNVNTEDIDWDELGKEVLKFLPMSQRELTIINAIQVNYVTVMAALKEENELHLEDMRVNMTSRITQLQTIIDQMTAEAQTVESQVTAQIEQVKADAIRELEKQKLEFERALEAERLSNLSQKQQFEVVKNQLENEISTNVGEVTDLRRQILDSKTLEQQKSDLIVSLQLELAGIKSEFHETNPFSPRYKSPNQQLPKPKTGTVVGIQDDDTVSMVHEAEEHAPLNEPATDDQGKPMVAAAIANVVKPVSISKYGIRIWNENETTLIEHFAMVMVGLEVAKDSGVTSEKSLLSLLFQSLPQKYAYAREYVSEKKNLSLVMSELVEILVGDRNRLLADFMKIQRLRNEPLLQYFTKLRRVYAYACNVALEDQESDQQVCRLMVQKLQDSMEISFQTEFEKKLDDEMTKGSLTMKKISLALISVSKFMKKTQIAAQLLIASTNGKARCVICFKPGHFAEDCWSKLTCDKCGNKGHPTERCRFIGSIGGNERETTTDGIQAVSNRARDRSKGCWQCGELGHIRSNCPNRKSSNNN